MKTVVTIVLLVAIHTAALGDRYGVAEAMEESGPFPSWGWIALFFLAVGYAIYQHREHREVERSTQNLANSAIQEARRNERQLTKAVAKLERERAAAWDELSTAEERTLRTSSGVARQWQTSSCD
jgi:hypothetical protein